MKLLRFNKSALLKALRLCALLLMYAASQSALKAQFNPTTGTAGNDSVTASGTFTGSFLGGGGSDTIIINLGANVTGDAASVIEINAGSVTNNGSLSNTYNGYAFGISSDSNEDGNFTLLNNSNIYVESTAGTNAAATGTFSSVYTLNNNAGITVTNSGDVTVLSGPGSSHSFAYGSLITTGSKFGNSLINYTNNSGLYVTAADSGYSWAAGVYIYSNGSTSNYGDFTVNLENHGTIRVEAGNSTSSNSAAYGIYAGQSREHGDVLIVGTNDGNVYVNSGYSADSSHSLASAFTLESTSKYGNATTQFTNSGYLAVQSGSIYNSDTTSNATGLSLSSTSKYGNASSTAANSGYLRIQSGSTNYADTATSAAGISISSYSKYGNVAGTAANSGEIHVESGSANYTDSTTSATGISISAISASGNIATATASNTYSIYVRSGNAYANGTTSEATGISAYSTAYSAQTVVRNIGGRIQALAHGAFNSNAIGIDASSSGYFGATTVNNSGSIYAESRGGFATYVKGISVSTYGFSQGTTTVTNTGSIYIETGDSYRSGAYGISVDTQSSGQAIATITNGDNAYIGVLATSSYHSVEAYGISATSGHYLGNLTHAGSTTVNSSGSIYVRSGGSDNESSLAYGISAYAFGNYRGSVNVSNAGQITVYANYDYDHVADSASAYGISARSVSNYIADSTVSNSSSIHATAQAANIVGTATALSSYANGEYQASSRATNQAGGNLNTNANNSQYNSAYGLQSEARDSYFTDALASNQGSIRVESFNGIENRSLGIRASTSGQYGNATATNSGSIYSLSRYGNDIASTGISVFNNSYYAESMASNSGTIDSRSIYSGIINATGIEVTNSGTFAMTSVYNSGTINTYSNYSYYSTARGIFARSLSPNSEILVSNSGTINSSIGYSTNTSSAAGIYAISNGQTRVINTGKVSASNYSNGNAVGIYAGGDLVDVTNTAGTVETNGYSAIAVDATTAGTLNLNGISHINGVMSGLQGNDTLNLNFIGLTPAKAAALQTYLEGVGSGFGLFTVAGQTYAIEGWENFTLEATSFASLLANNPGLADFAKALDNLDGDIDPKLASLLTDIALGGKADENLSQLAGQNLIDAISGINLQLANQLTQDLISRAAALRNGPEGIDLSGFNVHDSSMLAQADLIGNQLTNLGMFADVGNPQIKDFPVDSGIRPAPAAKRWGAWMNGTGTVADQETADGITGYQSRSARATLGADFKATANLAVGILGGYSKDEAKGDGMEVDADSAIAGIYGVWAEKGWHAEGLAAYVHSLYDTDRMLAGTVNSGDTSGNAGVAAINGGYDFKFNDLTVGPMAGLQYSHSVVDGYTEKGPLALNVGDNTVESLQTILGAQLRYQINVSDVKITPQILASWHHEFMNDNNDVSTGFVNSPGVGVFNVDGREPERDYGVVGANVTMVVPGLELITFYAGYNAQVGQSTYISHSINGGLKVSF